MIRICKWCKEEFVINSPNQQYCCPEHALHAKRERNMFYMRDYRKKYSYTDKNGVKHRLYPTKNIGSKDAGLGPVPASDFKEEYILIKRDLFRLLRVRRI